MRRLIDYFRSRIRFKIILPFALLTLMVAITGVYLSTRLVSASLEERFDRQLVEAASVVADGLAQREQVQVSYLNTIAFTEGINQAILAGDLEKLQALVFPVVVTNNIDRVDVLDSTGNHVLTIYRPPDTDQVEDYVITTGTSLANWPPVEKVTSGVVDNRGDKYVALATIAGQDLFVTLGPVKRDDDVVGVVLVSSHTYNLLRSLKQASFAEVTLYNLTGELIDTTFPKRVDNLTDLALGSRGRMMLALDGESSPRDSIILGEREYGALVGIFKAREEPLGFYSVALQTTFIDSSGSTARNQMIVIFATALLLVFGIGYLSASRITGRLQHLMENAIAVASGDFSRRTNISSTDEIGLLARSLDHMTESLADYTKALEHRISELVALYDTSSAVTIKSGLNLEHVLQAVTDSVKGVMSGTDRVTVYLQDHNGEVLIPRAFAPNEPMRTSRLRLKQSDINELLASATKPKIVPFSDLTFYTPQGHLAAATHSSQIVIVPLIASQELIGLLTLTVEPTFSQNDLLNEDGERLLSTLANQAAIAIKNAQLFEATQKAYEELRQLDELKTQFINIAAHELRTPLGAMLGYASYVEKRVPPNLHKSMRFLSSSMLRMRTMVDAMLTIQRLDAGTAFLRLAPVDVRDIIKKVVTEYQPIAELEGHTINVNLADKLPIVQADAEKIGLVLSNLLSNAIKFTAEGGWIKVQAQDYLVGVLISISDNGVGIASHEQQHVFNRFYQVKADHLAGHGGMGLGLTIVKHLIELHNGQVWVESETGQGSTFFFTLPQEEPVVDATPSSLDRQPAYAKEGLVETA